MTSATAVNGAANIEHIVVLMLENRSFDHLFGAHAGANGLKGGENNLLDPTQPESPTNPSFPAAQGAPFAISMGQGPGRSLNATNTQLFGQSSGPAASQSPANAGFIKSYQVELTVADKVPNPSNADLAVVMQGFEADRLPAINALANAFCLCDAWFAEVPGPTHPNRLFTHAATSDGHALNVWSMKFTLKTIYEQLQDAGKTWATYEHDTNEVRNFSNISGATASFRQFGQFASDVQSGALPNYSFIIPQFNSTPAQPANSQHAPQDARYGDVLVADVYEALQANPDVWNKSVLIVTYDEHGGFYDHVAPGPAPNPDGKTSPTTGDPSYAPKFGFDRIGLRVPAIIASPWVAAGVVCSKPLQHTSIMATARKIFGVAGALTQRDAVANTFEHLFTQSAPRNDTPSTLPRPVLPVLPQANDPSHPANQPLDPTQRGLMLGVHNLTLASHPDGPGADLLPETQGEASAFIKARYQRHFGS
jgi:phospholipase C